MLKSIRSVRALQESFGKWLNFLPLSPNQITFLSILLAFLGYYSALKFGLAPSLYLFLLAFFCDALDGAIARLRHQRSGKGAFLDGISDRLVEFFLILTLFSMNVFSEYLLLLVLFFGTAMTAFVKAYSDHTQVIPKEIALKMPGYLERAERSMLLLLVLFLAVLGEISAADFLLLITSVLSVATFIQRLYYVLTFRKTSQEKYSQKM